MSRKANQYEVLAVHSLRDEARQFVDDVFPGAKVDVHISNVDGQLGVAAKIGETRPHSRDEVMACLTEIGVSQVLVVDPNAA